MKISHFNTFPYGGAAIAAKRMHGELNRLNAHQNTGWESEFCYYRDDQNSELDASFRRIEFAQPQYGLIQSVFEGRKRKKRQREIYRQFNEHLATRPVGVETFSMAELPQPTRLGWDSVNSDVVHLHWISFFADYPTFMQSIPDSVPLVWTLHDMNAFTGGCHYSNQCMQFRFGCGDCEQVINRGPQDVSRIGFAAKQKSLTKKTIHVVTPSVWMNELAQQSPIWPDNTTFQTIKLGFDLKQFRPIEKQIARQQLGIHSDAVLVGFGAEELGNRRKGIQHLLDALQSTYIRWCRQSDTEQRKAAETKTAAEIPKIEGLLFGAGKVPDLDGLPRIHEMGYVDSIERQRLIYSAADIVVVPSREDNQPQVGLEAMACGTPVVGFRAGGIPEYVRDGKTGLLAQLGDESDLADQIIRLAGDTKLRVQLGRQARSMMESEFDLRDQTRKYLHLYESAIGYRQIRRAA